MYTGQFATISNRATWQSPVIELIDETDGSTIDLADPSLTVDIAVTIKDADGCPRVTANLENGKVAIVGPGLQWRFEDTDLKQFCAGTYKLGLKITINGFIDDEIIGTLAVLEGNR